MAGYRDLTTEETILARQMLAAKAGLVLTPSGVYLLGNDEFCEKEDWQPDFNAEHAEMVDAALFVVSEVLMMRRDAGLVKQYRFSGVVAYDKPYVRTEWEDSMAAAMFDGAVRALQKEGEL